MTVASRLVGRVLALPPAVTRRITVERDIEVRAADGVVLRTDHYAPDHPGAPTVLIRTPYGRKGVLGLLVGRSLAERGFHVVLSSCRGTFDSGGEFQPLRNERGDGLDTIDWLGKQPWFTGTLFTYGPSYVGFTQWAIADSPAVGGCLMAVTASSFRDPTYVGGSFSLDTILNWATLLGNQGGSLLSFAAKQARSQRRVRRAFAHLPLAGMDTIASGSPIGFWQEWLAAGADPAYWSPRSHDQRVESVTAPICMVGGWYDIFLPWQLRDYARLRAAGARPRLVIGPWTHASRDLLRASLVEAIRWYRDIGAGTPTGNVRLHVGGVNEWRSYDAWPPAASDTPWYLGAGRTLSPDGPADADAVDRFTYDPADPTPSPGGPLLTTQAGRVDNGPTERRPDVLVYTSQPLAADLETIGPVRATVRVTASRPHFDVFVRICEVDERARSENICDGLLRVTGTAGEERDVEVELWPIAYRWRRGARIRVQIAGAAYPRYARNTGSGEPLGTAADTRPIEYAIRLAGSAIHLPVQSA